MNTVTDSYSNKHLRKRSKFDSNKKVEASTYNQARLEGVYRTPISVAASYQPKAMYSTPLNNRRGDKKMISLNRKVSSTFNKKDPFLLSQFNSRAPSRDRNTKNLIQSFNRRSTQSEDKLIEGVKAEEQTQNQSETEL